MLDGCAADLGTTAPAWLTARDEVASEIDHGYSVNLVTLGEDLAWWELVEDLRDNRLPGLAVVDLQKPHTIERTGLCEEILRALGMKGVDLPKKPKDLARFTDHLEGLGRMVRVALVNFDIAVSRKDYDANFYATLRWLITERRNLILLAQSHRPFDLLLPKDNPLSGLDLKTVELR